MARAAPRSAGAPWCWRALRCGPRAPGRTARPPAGWRAVRWRRCSPNSGPGGSPPGRGAAGGLSLYPGPVLVLKVIFWASLGALVWTHALYPLFVALLARLRPRPARADDDYRPRVALVIAAYNEHDVIA